MDIRIKGGERWKHVSIHALPFAEVVEFKGLIPSSARVSTEES